VIARVKKEIVQYIDFHSFSPFFITTHFKLKKSKFFAGKKGRRCYYFTAIIRIVVGKATNYGKQQTTAGNKIRCYFVTFVSLCEKKSAVNVYHHNYYIFLLYCPPTLYSALVICPREQYFTVSISSSNKLPLLIATCCSCFNLPAASFLWHV
jgi:hypothetical protein